MPFDPSKDQLIWQCPEMSIDKLIISIKQYGNYPAKLEFTRHVPTQQDPNAIRGAGRLTYHDWQLIKKYAGQIEQLMEQYAKPQQQGQASSGSIPNQTYQG